jgi:ribosomal protein L19
MQALLKINYPVKILPMANQATHKETSFHVGDTVRVHQSIKEGDKSRIQIFEGVVIAIHAKDDPTFVVRRSQPARLV